MKKYKVYTKEKGIIETNDGSGILELTLHRVDGPAYIRYDINANKKIEEYCVDGKIHRLNGPAVIQYAEDGNIIYEVYYINGIEYTEENYHKELLKLKLQGL